MFWRISRGRDKNVVLRTGVIAVSATDFALKLGEDTVCVGTVSNVR